MTSLQGAGSRLRRTFHYPDDSTSDSDDHREAIDEQEQDKLIRTLVQENKRRNEQFSRFLITLPLAATAAYARPLLRPATSVFALLSVTSLLIASFLLYKLPATETGIEFVDSWARRTGPNKKKGKARESYFFPSRARFMMPATSYSGGGAGARSPLETYLPYMNVALVLLLMLMGLVRGDERGGGFGWVSMGTLPALIYSVIITAKVVMAGVDPERDLTGLRYDYKGA